MTRILLLQLPIPQLNYGRRTGNIPLAAACLAQAVDGVGNLSVEILPESIASYLGDAALIRLMAAAKPDIIGFTLFNWNIERSLFIAQQLQKTAHPKIIFGGPEVTPDNTLPGLSTADFLVFGQGESIFRQLLLDDRAWQQKQAQGHTDNRFSSTQSPYLAGLLEPEINRMMYLETQRGCPYKCGFCYYNKSMKQLSRVSEDVVRQAVSWGLQHRVDELCLLDPSLNARPDLAALLRTIGDLNAQGQISISGETRAEQIDPDTADLFARAGFSLFEIGLQSTNPEALSIMNRKTDLARFVRGTALLKERDIIPRIDLIVGLPGDSLAAFKRSVDFVADHDLYDDIMVFPLSVLPGTDFRKNSNSLQLAYEPQPPYSIVSTPGFSSEEMIAAFDYAEEVFDIALFPDPHLDLSYRNHKAAFAPDDHRVLIHEKEYVSKLIVRPERALGEIEKAAGMLTQPYQIFVMPEVTDQDHLFKILEITSAQNPYTPFEVVFLNPAFPIRTGELLAAIQIKRPHYLDNDLRLLYDSPGNRAVLFTLLSSRESIFFRGAMQRQVFWWQGPGLPGRQDLDLLSGCTGLLIDTRHTDPEIHRWQDRFCMVAPDILFISFAVTSHQKRWMALTAADEYYMDVC